MLQHLRPAVVMIALFTLVTGVAYPLVVTGVAQLALRGPANGDLVRDGSGKVVGSAIIGQAFARPEYLHPRPSAAGNGYDPTQSGGSNLGPLDKKLADRIAGDAKVLSKEAPRRPIPADAVTASGSGLDPDISPENARRQAGRIAGARHAPAAAVAAVIAAQVQEPLFGFIGEPRVNVTLANLALDARFPVSRPGN